MRTYSGHSSARASNELYRTNLAQGQTGLSIAFDLPTQTGYDPDHILARGEVGKVGVPVVHLGDMKTLLDGIPPGEMLMSKVSRRPICAARHRTTFSKNICRAERLYFRHNHQRELLLT